MARPRGPVKKNTNTLRLASVGGARQPNPSPDETWGLHIGDVNLATRSLTRTPAAARRFLATWR